MGAVRSFESRISAAGLQGTTARIAAESPGFADQATRRGSAQEPASCLNFPSHITPQPRGQQAKETDQMSNIVPFRATLQPVDAPMTMSSREIADLVEKRHDNVKRTVEMLADRGTIVRPQIEDEQDTDTMGRVRTTSVYHLDKRSSFIVVAQLSPEFTARLVDRWQQLEDEKASGGFALPQNYEQALEGLLVQVRQNNALMIENQQQRQVIAEQAPAVAAQERLAKTEGALNLSDAARCLGMSQTKFNKWLVANRWIFRKKDGSNRPVPYADKRNAGYMEVVGSTQRLLHGDVFVQSTYVTPKGLSKLAEIHGIEGWEL